MKTSILLRLALLFAALFSSMDAIAADTSAAFTPAQQTQIQKIIQDYILKNPQVIVQAMQNLQKQARNDMMKQAQQVIDNQAQALFSAPNSPIAGNPKGNITLLEFFDYQCPYCKRIAAAINELTTQNKNLRIVYKELPIFGDSSVFASQAALAAQVQNKYLPFHNALMAAKPPFNSQQILEVAKSVGIDINKLQTDMKSKAVTEELKNNMALANAMQLVGTPAFVVAKVTITDNKADKPVKSVFIPGAMNADNLKQVIQQVQTGK